MAPTAGRAATEGTLPVAGERFHLITSNPPYVPSPDGRIPTRGAARAWEGGSDGRALLDQICAGARSHLHPGGAILLVHSAVCGERATVQALAAQGLAVDAAGNLFIADSGNHRIRKVSPDGIITTVAGSGPIGPDKGYAAGDGGPALAATLRGPFGLAVDGAGNLFLTEQDPNGTGTYTGPRFQVLKVSADGIILTVVGSGLKGFSGDGGLALGASLDNLLGVAVDTAGNLFIADYNNYRVRKVDTYGIISTMAGTGKNPYAGDGVLATTTGLRGPIGVAVDAAGNLLVTDSERYFHEADGLGSYNERVLKVFGVAAPGLLAGLPFPKKGP